MTNAKKSTGISRRKLLKTGAAAIGVAAGSGVITGFPTVWAQTPITLRQFGTGVSNLNDIADKCKADLGITLEMTAMDSDAAAQRAVTQPDSYDIADIEYWILKKVYPAGVLQPMDVTKLTYYDSIVPLFKNGKLKPDSVIAQGTAPHTVGYVESADSKTFADHETGWFTMVPTIYNADTLGIRPDLVGRDITTWADIMDPAFKGKTAILNIPSIGIMDAAMIMEAMGNIKYVDKGNMTTDEIDKTIDFLIKTKQAGQFRAFWKSFDESVNLMASGEVVIQSMWSPAVAAVRSKGIPCKYQPLKEGYRSWGGGLGLASHLSGADARRGLRVHQLVHVGLGRRLPEPAGLLFGEHDHGEEVHVRRRVGLLDRGQARAGRHPRSRRQGHGESRRGARRRLLRRAHGPCRLLELGHGRGPLHGETLERVHRRVTSASDTAAVGFSAAASAEKKRRRLRFGVGRLAPYLQAAPLAIVLGLFLAVPILTIIVVSFWDYDFARLYPDFITTNYSDVLGSWVTWKTYLNTIKYAAIVWAITLFIGFWVAYFLAFHIRTTTMQMVLFLVCTVPFLTSNIIRMISWIPVLGRNGLINSALVGAGIVHQPIEWLLYSDFAVVWAMVHLYTLFMVTPIFNTLMRIDRSLVEAARDAGASGRADHLERHRAAGEARHGDRHDLRRHAGDGGLLHRAGHVRRPERVGRADDEEPDVAAAISGSRGQRRRAPRRRPRHGRRHPARRRHPQGALRWPTKSAAPASMCSRRSSRFSCSSSTGRFPPSSSSRSRGRTAGSPSR